MTALALFLLVIILFLVSYLYFSHLNPHEFTVYYLSDQSVTASAAIVLLGCILIGLLIGYLIHLYSVGSHLFQNWKRDRAEKHSREVSSLYRDGVARLLSGDLKRAHELLRRAREREPGRTDVLIALADIHLQAGEHKHGADLLLQAKSLEPRNLEILFKLAGAYEEMKREEEASRLYEEVLDIDRENRRAMRALRDRHIVNGRWREALEVHSRLLKTAAVGNRLEEEKMLLHLRYEVARLLLDEKLGEAQAALLEIVREAPDFTPARVSLGDAYRVQRRTEEAARTWQEGYRRSGQGVFLTRLENLYMEAEDPAPLVSYYREAISGKSDDLMLRLFFGKLCLRLEMIEEAVQHLCFIENSGADFPQLHFLLAEAYRRGERTNESLEEYQRALGGHDPLRIDFSCSACGKGSPAWHSQCPRCGAWGSLSIAGNNELRAVREPRDSHHGER